MAATTPPWPFNIADPVRAVHLAMDPDCQYSDCSRCPDEAMARRVIAAYTTWLAAQPTKAES